MFDYRRGLEKFKTVKFMKNKQFDNRHIPAKYIARFMAWNSAPDMLEMKLFPNIKEVAESMSMFYCVESLLMNWDEYIRDNRRNQNINVVVVGDGHRPRTGALFAYSTKWNVVSIDPEMKSVDYPIQRLKCYDCKVEDVPDIDFGDEPLIIIYPHSHAPVQVGWDKFQSTRKWLIKMECCTKDKLDLPYYAFRDTNAITAANQIFIWCNYMTLSFGNNETNAFGLSGKIPKLEEVFR